MDVRCEKCQTEYELDEARLKPGGVTVKCTNCGHMFKIRKRTITNVGAPAPAASERPRTSSSKPPGYARADSVLGDVTKQMSPTTAATLANQGDEGPTAVDRQWLIRLENGERKSCRELATLQQWIAGGLVTRESLISRTGKTWKRLGDIAELAQYFAAGDEARTIHRTSRNTGKPTSPQQSPSPSPQAQAQAAPVPSTMIGLAGGPQAAGGTILPDDEDYDDIEGKTTGNFKARPGAAAAAHAPPPVPGATANPKARTPAMGSNMATAAATARTEMFPGPVVAPAPAAPPPVAAGAPTMLAEVPPMPVAVPPKRRPTTQPPPPPQPQRKVADAGPQPSAIPAVPQGNRATAAWASESPMKVTSGPQSQPFGGKLSAIPDEPAFAGRVRIAPGDDSSFQSGKVASIDDDSDDMFREKRTSRAGMWVLVMALLVMAAAAAVVYVVVFRKGKQEAAQAKLDAGTQVVAQAADAAPAPAIDAAPAPAPSPLDTARGELAADVEPRLRTAVQSLEALTDAPAQALRAHLIAQLAQDLGDRAALTADKTEAGKLRTDAKQLALDAATAAQRALKAQADEPTANLAMAEVLRLQGKSAREQKRYLDAARAKEPRDAALAEALGLARDGKAEDARAAFAALDSADGALEKSGDVRARFHTALQLLALNKAVDAKALNDQVLAAQPEHAGAKALAAKLATLVAKTDAMPPEDGQHPTPPGPGPGPTPPGPGPTPPGPEPVASGGSYDSILARANSLAETNCTKAMDLFSKALEQKPNGVEALSGMGYCHIDAKQFASAFSKFRAALAVSPRYEPALWGVAEAYQQQGRKEQAIESYKAYLEVYPDSAKAKKQLQLLGVDGGSGAAPTPPTPTPQGSDTPPAPTPPAPTPTPAPVPVTSPEGAGSGSP